MPAPSKEGWNWFEQTEQAASKATLGTTGLEARDLQMAIARALTTPDGKILMQHLRDWCIMVKDFDPSLGFYNGAAFGFYRAGQNDLYKYLQNIVNKETT